MLIEENGAQTIKTINETEQTEKNKSLITLCRLTLGVIKKQFPNFIY